MSLNTSLFSKTVLVSGDFGDAYTMSLIARLKDSVVYLGTALKYPGYIISLILDLIDLVFENCYFFTPYGLYKQANQHNFLDS